MFKHQWLKIEEIFNNSVRLPADERPAFVERECAGDNELLDQLWVLLKNDDQIDSFLDEPLLNLGIQLLQNDYLQDPNNKVKPSITD